MVDRILCRYRLRFSIFLTNIQEWIEIFIRHLDIIIENNTIDSTLLCIQMDGFQFILGWDYGQLNVSLIYSKNRTICQRIGYEGVSVRAFQTYNYAFLLKANSS